MKTMTMRSNRTVAWFVDPANKAEPGVSRVGGPCVEAARNGLERWRTRRLNGTSIPDCKPSAAPKRKPAILLPVDFSANSLEAVKTGVRLALETDARLVLLHVVHLNLIPHGPANPAWLREALCEEAREQAQPLMNFAQSAGVQALCAVEAGVQSEVILQVARQWEAELIVLSARPRNWFARLFRRRTVEEVVRSAKCPVMVLSMDRRSKC
jgi:nucleotide-binding universal stress UspA family protein